MSIVRTALKKVFRHIGGLVDPLSVDASPLMPQRCLADDYIDAYALSKPTYTGQQLLALRALAEQRATAAYAARHKAGKWAGIMLIASLLAASGALENIHFIGLTAANIPPEIPIILALLFAIRMHVADMTTQFHDLLMFRIDQRRETAADRNSIWYRSTNTDTLIKFVSSRHSDGMHALNATRLYTAMFIAIISPSILYLSISMIFNPSYSYIISIIIVIMIYGSQYIAHLIPQILFSERHADSSLFPAPPNQANEKSADGP